MKTRANRLPKAADCASNIVGRLFSYDPYNRTGWQLWPSCKVDIGKALDWEPVFRARGFQ